MLTTFLKLRTYVIQPKLHMCGEGPEFLYCMFPTLSGCAQGASLGFRPASVTSVCAVLAPLCHQHSTEALAYCEHDNSSALLVSVIAPALFSLKPILVNRVFKSICS